MRYFSGALQKRHYIMGLGVFAVYLLMLLLVLLRMPYAAGSFSVNGMIAVLASFGLITWCGVKKCSSHITLAAALLMIIGACTQCVISGTAPMKQAALFAVSTAAGLFAALFWNKLAPLLERYDPVKTLGAIAGASGALYLTLLVFGKEINGTKAWLLLGGLSLELTEPAKLLAALFFACLFSRKEIGDPKKIAAAVGFYVYNALFLTLINELGTLLVMTFVLISMCFLFIASRKYTLIFILSFAVIMCAGYLLIHTLSDHAAAAAEMGRQPGALGAFAVRAADKLNDRFELWLHLDRLDSNGIAYQSLKARDAIIVGGFFGSELNVHIPFSGSDFIFPSMILRFGLAMGIAVFLLFYTIYYYGMAVCTVLRPSVSQTMCAACTFSIVIQALLMIFGSTNFFIMTGIPVPFLSAGGSAQVIVFIMSALLIRFSEGTEGVAEE